MKKIAIIVNNYGQKYDGIGAYSKVMSENFSASLKYDIYTSICNPEDGRISKIFNVGMSRCFFKLIRNINKYNTVMIEYPFVEWNPIIVIVFMLLRLVTKIKNIKIILSLHEYERVNALRKAVIEVLASYSDLVIVSNENTKKSISKYNSNVLIREIPTNIYGIIRRKTEQSMNKYVYFGLVNNSKAFQEMVDGWDKFNYKNKYILYIVTGTKLYDIEAKHRNVRYVYNADNDAVFSILNSCMFSVLPIKPEIDEKNATFKAGALAGCLCIGKFCERFKDKEFILNMDGYTDTDFYNVFVESSLIGYEKSIMLGKAAYEYGSLFTPEKVARLIESYITER